MDCSLPASSVLGIFQAIVLEWIAISFSRDLKYSANEPVYETRTDSQAQRTGLWLPREGGTGEGWRESLGLADANDDIEND